VIDLRAGILAVTICFIIALAADVPPKPFPQNAPLCMQPVWDKYGRRIGGYWVPCTDLDRYEQA
jgi:hypothetical protein